MVTTHKEPGVGPYHGPIIQWLLTHTAGKIKSCFKVEFA